MSGIPLTSYPFWIKVRQKTPLESSSRVIKTFFFRPLLYSLLQILLSQTNQHLVLLFFLCLNFRKFQGIFKVQLLRRVLQ